MKRPNSSRSYDNRLREPPPETFLAFGRDYDAFLSALPEVSLLDTASSSLGRSPDFLTRHSIDIQAQDAFIRELAWAEVRGQLRSLPAKSVDPRAAYVWLKSEEDRIRQVITTVVIVDGFADEPTDALLARLPVHKAGALWAKERCGGPSAAAARLSDGCHQNKYCFDKDHVYRGAASAQDYISTEARWNLDRGEDLFSARKEVLFSRWDAIYSVYLWAKTQPGLKHRKGSALFDALAAKFDPIKLFDDARGGDNPQVRALHDVRHRWLAFAARSVFAKRVSHRAA